MTKNTNYMLTKNNCPACTGLKNKLDSLGVDYETINMDIEKQSKEGNQLLHDLACVNILFGGFPILLCVNHFGHVSGHVHGDPPLANVKKALKIKTGRGK